MSSSDLDSLSSASRRRFDLGKPGVLNAISSQNSSDLSVMGLPGWDSPVRRRRPPRPLMHQLPKEGVKSPVRRENARIRSRPPISRSQDSHTEREKTRRKRAQAGGATITTDSKDQSASALASIGELQVGENERRTGNGQDFGQDCEVSLEFPKASWRSRENIDLHAVSPVEDMPPADLKGLLRFMQRSPRNPATEEKSFVRIEKTDEGPQKITETREVALLVSENNQDSAKLIERNSEDASLNLISLTKSNTLTSNQNLRTDPSRVLEPVMNNAPPNRDCLQSYASHQESKKEKVLLSAPDTDLDSSKSPSLLDIDSLVGTTPALEALLQLEKPELDLDDSMTQKEGLHKTVSSIGFRQDRLEPEIEELEDTATFRSTSAQRRSPMREARPKFYEQDAAFFREKIAYFSEPVFQPKRIGYSHMSTLTKSAELLKEHHSVNPAGNSGHPFRLSGQTQFGDRRNCSIEVKREPVNVSLRPTKDSMAYRGAPLIPTLQPAAPRPFRGLGPSMRRMHVKQEASPKVAASANNMDVQSRIWGKEVPRAEVKDISTKRTNIEVFKKNFTPKCSNREGRSQQAENDCVVSNGIPIESEDKVTHTPKPSDETIKENTSRNQNKQEFEKSIESDRTQGILQYMNWLSYTCEQLSLAGSRATDEAKTYINNSKDIVESAELQELAFAKVVQLSEAALQVPQNPSEIDDKDNFQESIRAEEIRWPVPSCIRATPPPLLLPPPGPPILTLRETENKSNEQAETKVLRESCIRMHRAVGTLAAAFLRASMETAINTVTLANAHRCEFQTLERTLKMQNAAFMRDLREEATKKVASELEERENLIHDITLKHQEDVQELMQRIEVTEERKAEIETELERTSGEVRDLEERHQQEIAYLKQTFEREHEAKMIHLRTELSIQYEEKERRSHEELRESYSMQLDDLKEKNEQKSSELEGVRRELRVAERQIGQFQKEKDDFERELTERFEVELKKVRHESTAALNKLGEKAAKAAAVNSRQLERVTQEAEEKYEARVQELHRTIDEIRAELQLQKLETERKMREAKHVGIKEGERLGQERVAQQRLVYEKKMVSLEATLAKFRSSMKYLRQLDQEGRSKDTESGSTLGIDTSYHSRAGLEQLLDVAIASELGSSEEDWGFTEPINQSTQVLNEDNQVWSAGLDGNEGSGESSNKMRLPALIDQLHLLPRSSSNETRDEKNIPKILNVKVSEEEKAITDTKRTVEIEKETEAASSIDLKFQNLRFPQSPRPEIEIQLVPNPSRITKEKANRKGLHTTEATKAVERRMQEEITLNPTRDPSLAPHSVFKREGEVTRSTESDLKYTTMLDHYITENPI